MPPRSPTSKPPSNQFTPTSHLVFTQSEGKESPWSSISGCVDVGTSRKYFLARIHLNLRAGRESEDLRTILRVLSENLQEIDDHFIDPMLR